MSKRGVYTSIVVIIGMALISIVALAALRPTDSPLLISVVIAFVAPTILALVALLKIDEVHGLVNSRMSELLSLMRSQGQHEGREMERGQTSTEPYVEPEDPDRRTL